MDQSATARANGVALGSVTDGSTSLGLPYTGSAPNLTPNTTYYQDSLFGYNIYTVVPTRSITAGLGEDSNLVDLFVGSGSAICATADPGPPPISSASTASPRAKAPAGARP